MLARWLNRHIHKNTKIRLERWNSFPSIEPIHRKIIFPFFTPRNINFCKDGINLHFQQGSKIESGLTWSCAFFNWCPKISWEMNNPVFFKDITIIPKESYYHGEINGRERGTLSSPSILAISFGARILDDSRAGPQYRSVSQSTSFAAAVPAGPYNATEK